MDTLFATNAKQVQQSMLNVHSRRVFGLFGHTRGRGWGWDCAFTSTCHGAHLSLALGAAKLLSIVDVVAWDFWVVKNEVHISRQDKTFFHTFFVYLRHVRRERDGQASGSLHHETTLVRHQGKPKRLALPVVVGRFQVRLD